MSTDNFVTIDIGIHEKETQKGKETQKDKERSIFYSMIVIGIVLILLLVGVFLIWKFVLKD